MNLDIPRFRLTPDHLNPRKTFDEAKLAELTDNIRLHGVLSNLIVRPVWCAGLVTEAELRQHMAGGPALDVGDYKIVSGERRWLAAGAVDEDMVMPCRVKPMTDPEVLAINLSEQMQRNELTPLEEAEAFAQMLAFKDEQGAALHTAESLGASVGKSHDYVYSRLKLRALPARVAKALASGTITAGAAEMVARVPDEHSREEVGTLALTGGRDGGPMTVAELAVVIAEQFMVELKGAPFDQEDAALCVETAPGGPGHGVWSGRCSDCPHRSGNRPDFVKKKGARGDMCTHPTCYRFKCAAAFQIIASEAASHGVQVLTDKDSARHFETHRPTEVRIYSDWVELDTRPMAHLLKDEVKNPPTWRELVVKAEAAGMKPEVVLAKDGAGRARWLVNSTLLIAAAEKLGEPIFRGQKTEDGGQVAPRPGEDADDTFKRGKREHAEQMRKDAAAAADAARLRDLVNGHAVRAVHAALAKRWTSAPIWEVMLGFMTLYTIPEQWLVQKLCATKETDVKKLRKVIAAQPRAHQQAMVPIMLAAPDIANAGVDSPILRGLADFAGVDLAAVVKQATAEVKAPKAAKANRGNAEGRKARKKPGKKPAKAGKGGAK